MEAHRRLLDGGYQVGSFGVGTKVKVPGLTKDELIVFTFNTPYHIIKKVLEKKDINAYIINGLIELCKRNELIKKAPQKWQTNFCVNFDVILTFEKYVFDKV